MPQLINIALHAREEQPVSIHQFTQRYRARDLEARAAATRTVTGRRSIKTSLPKQLAEKFRRYVAENYGYKRRAFQRTAADLIEKELEGCGGGGTADGIVGPGL